jgi:DivIVA domain-containing protein
MSALPPGVRAGGAFPKAKGRGYNAAQVDVFMANARGLSAEAIREVRFEAAKKHAYEIDAVDAALDRLETEARAREL